MGGQLKAVVVLVSVLAAVFVGASTARAEWDGDEVKVSIAPVSESDDKVIVTVTSMCDNEIPLSFSTGRHAPADPSIRTYRSDYDGRGDEAAAVSDYEARSGSITVSKSRKTSFAVSLIDDGVAEPLEHVRILIESSNGTAAFAGDEWVCSDTPGDGDVYIESAFTIVDDDSARAKQSSGGAGNAVAAPDKPAIATSTTPAPSSKVTSATTALGTNDDNETADDSRGAVPAEAAGSHAARDVSSSNGLVSTLAALTVAIGAGVTALIWRRRRRPSVASREAQRPRR
ncbi:MAG: hypothetical protein WD826_11450 [Actinomycetota bacterium]